MLSYFSQNKIQSRLPYEPNDFLFRWKKIERVVSKQNIDGLLLIAGPDGNHNQQTIKVLNWLFFGESGQLISKSAYIPETFNDLIVFISKNSNIFLSPNAKKHLSQYIYCLPTMEVFSPTDAQFQIKDVFDILKISEFYRIVKNHKKIGVLSEINSIQKWPLIQSFALEQVGGAFFTMRFQVEDLTSKIEGIYKNHDKHSLKTIYEITSKRMLGYLIGTTSVIESTSIQKRSSLTQFLLCQPIKQAIEIQQLEQSLNSNISFEINKPTLLIGERTNNQSGQSGQTNIGQNFHMTIDYSDTNSQLRVCRTYFLGIGTKITEEVVEQDVPQSDTFIVDKIYSLKRTANIHYKNQHILMTLYCQLVESTLQAIVGITKDYRNLNVQYIHSVILAKISNALKDIYSFFPHLNIQVKLFSYNSLGELQKVDFKDTVSFKLTPYYHIVKTSIKDIPSQDQKSILGSVIFSQSFVLQEGCYMLFTKDIPYFDIFNCHAQSFLNNLNPNLKFEQLGIAVGQAPECKLFASINSIQQAKASYIPLLNVNIQFYQKGLRIYSQKLGWLIIPYNYMSKVQLLNSISGYWLQIQLIDQIILTGLTSNQIVIGLTSKAQQIFRNTLQKLKESFKFVELSEIPQALADNDYFLKAVVKQKDLGLITYSQVVNSQFLFSYLEAKQLLILSNMRDLKLSTFRSIFNKPDGPLAQKQLSKQHILIINGTYASGKNRFATNLLRYSRQNRFNSSIFTINHENLPNKLDLTIFLSMLQQFITEQPQKSNNLTIVVLPCWINSKQFLDTASQKYDIRCVCTKINVSNFYSTVNYQLTQNTLTYATPGYSQFVILDTYGQDESYISQITNIAWKYSPNSKLYNIANNSISSGVARDIYTTAKYMSESQIFLRNKYLIFYEFKLNFELRFVEIKVPVKTKEIITVLKQNEGYLFSKQLLQKELQRERMQAKNSKDELLQTLYQIKERITIQKRKGSSMRLLWFKGNLRFIEEKQIQQVTWTNLFYRQKPNKTSQILGLSILSTKWNEHEFQQFIDELSQKSAFMSKIKQLLRVESLRPDQIKIIERTNRDKYLQNGDFFDGSFFRDCEGIILKSHPKLPLLLQEHVEAENQAIKQYNQSVIQQWQNYKNSFKK